jgi:undecaprenyl-diphosphatase
MTHHLEPAGDGEAGKRLRGDVLVEGPAEEGLDGGHGHRGVVGLVLAVADAVGRQERDLTCLTYKHGILYGFAQAMALIPGVSRSGGTITAGLLMGYTREAAARYSFLLAIPAVFGSGLYQLYKVLSKEGLTGPYGLPETALATVIAFGVGYVIIGWFLKFVSTRSYRLFVWYRIFLGMALYILLGFNVINA